MDDDELGLPIVGAAPGPSFERRTVTIGPGRVLTYEDADWRGAIVVVVEGEVELEGRAGARRRFPRGAVVWTDGLDLRALSNPGRVATVLVAISRRADRIEQPAIDPMPPTPVRRLKCRGRIDRERPEQPRGAQAMSDTNSISTSSPDREPAMSPPASNPDLAGLGRLVGTWKVAGGATGTAAYEWMDGGFFLIQRVELERHGQAIRGLELIGHEQAFGAEPGEDIRSRFYDNMGNTLDYVYEMDGDTLTIWGGEKGSPAYFKGTFSDDGDTLTGSWVYPGGGGYESAMTRTR